MEEKYKGISIQNSAGAGAMSVFKTRETYDQVFPTVVDSYNFNESKNFMYGRINSKNDIVHPNEYYLKQINTSKTSNLFCFNFVADAFEDFRDSFKTQYGNVLKKDEFFTSDWDAVTSFNSPHEFYGSRMDELGDAFIKGDLFLKNNKQFVKNIDDFVRIFFNDFYPALDKKMPITKSGLIASKYFNPANTGLCIEISSDSAGLEYVKFNKFIKSPNFEFYLLNAANHGFLVDKNLPWRLVANLNSSKMQQYMSLYDLNKENVFDTCYVKTHLYDIQNLKVYIKQMYESFLSISPNYEKEIPVVGTLKCPPDKLQSKEVTPREKISLEQFKSKYSDLFWLKIYYRLKLDEIGAKYSKQLLAKELYKIEQVYSKNLILDSNPALEYINNRIKLQTNWV